MSETVLVVVNGSLETRQFSHSEEFPSLGVRVDMPVYNNRKEKPYYDHQAGRVVIRAVEHKPLWGSNKNAKRP